MLLSAIRTGKQFQARCPQSFETGIVNAQHPFVDQVEVHLHPCLESGVGEFNRGGKIGVFWACGYQDAERPFFHLHPQDKNLYKPLKLNNYFLSTGIFFTIPLLPGKRQIKKVLEEAGKEEK
jgi:hypothetical protein